MSDNGPQISILQSMAAAAIIVAPIMAIFLFLRLIFTTKSGSIAGFILAMMIMAAVVFSPKNTSINQSPPPDPVASATADLERAVRDFTTRHQATTASGR